ncbi:MAG: hypothetical protein IT373_10310, partial [Polyangiaceae bacterium]|nr:hypothetical protein [Polyangiaceae bacterium]
MPRLAPRRPTVRHLAPLVALALGGCAIHYPYYPLPQIPNDDADLGSRLGWLEGSWFRQDGGLESELHFTTARGGTLLGTSRTVALHGLEGAGGSDGGVRTVEHALVLIEHTEGGVVYRSWPKGKDAASLRLVAARV